MAQRVAAHGPYGKWVDQGPVTAPPAEQPEKTVRVLAIPQAGMGAWAFHAWRAKLPPFVELLPIELPGRGSRMLEPRAASLPACARALVAGLPERVFRDGTPYVLLGHSFGSWVAFETLLELDRQGFPPPKCLVVSGARAPHLHRAEDDLDALCPALGSLPTSDAFWRHFERRYGKNPDLQSATIRRYVEPGLRADFQLLEAYEGPSSSSVKVKVPIVACAARGDDRVSDAQLDAWRRYAGGGPGDDDAFQVRRFDCTPLPWSTPHRFLLESPDAFLAFLVSKCRGLVSAAQEASPSSSEGATSQAVVTPVPALPPPGTYVVSGPAGALVRAGVDLSTEQVGVVDKGEEVVVVEAAEPPPNGAGKPRLRLASPLQGWVSSHVLRPKVVSSS